jgi:hypothetical protein
MLKIIYKYFAGKWIIKVNDNYTFFINIDIYLGNSENFNFSNKQKIQQNDIIMPNVDSSHLIICAEDIKHVHIFLVEYVLNL